MKRSGIADLPLHSGRVPQWLADRMTKLGTGIVEAVVERYGRSALLTRLSDPFWFQALGSVMGMDWHSSGITTSVLGALKRGLQDRSDELGIYICGGRGRHSRNTPQELRALADRRGFDGEALVRTSRLTARIDNNAIADGFQIYLHSFIVTSEGEWAVVQQGLNDASGLARRYHWHSATLSLVAEVVHGTPTRFSDPARFSFALGGKDRHPFPVPLKTYDEAITVLRSALAAAKIGQSEKTGGFERLHRFVRTVERRCQPEADFKAAIEKDAG